MERVRWLLLNTLHAFFLAFWSVWWMSLAAVSCVLLRNPQLGLRWARTYWAPGLFWACGAKLDVQGLDKVDWNKPAVFVVNHQSMIDIPALQAALPSNIRFIFKAELLKVPFLGAYCRAVGMIPVDRGNTPQAVARLQDAARQVVNDNAHVMAFAEGTRSRTGVIAPFKKGAFMLALQAGAPVIPVAIEGARKALPPDGFHVRPETIHVRIGDPIPTAGLTGNERDALMDKARAAVVRMNLGLGGLGGMPALVDGGAAVVVPALSLEVSSAPRRAVG